MIRPHDVQKKAMKKLQLLPETDLLCKVKDCAIYCDVFMQPKFYKAWDITRYLELLVGKLAAPLWELKTIAAQLLDDVSTVLF